MTHVGLFGPTWYPICFPCHMQFFRQERWALDLAGLRIAGFFAANYKSQKHIKNVKKRLKMWPNGQMSQMRKNQGKTCLHRNHPNLGCLDISRNFSNSEGKGKWRKTRRRCSSKSLEIFRNPSKSLENFWTLLQNLIVACNSVESGSLGVVSMENTMYVWLSWLVCVALTAEKTLFFGWLHFCQVTFVPCLGCSANSCLAQVYQAPIVG